jgi:hypothetical protein
MNTENQESSSKKEKKDKGEKQKVVFMKATPLAAEDRHGVQILRFSESMAKAASGGGSEGGGSCGFHDAHSALHNAHPSRAITHPTSHDTRRSFWP